MFPNWCKCFNWGAKFVLLENSLTFSDVPLLYGMLVFLLSTPILGFLKLLDFKFLMFVNLLLSLLRTRRNLVSPDIYRMIPLLWVLCLITGFQRSWWSLGGWRWCPDCKPSSNMLRGSAWRRSQPAGTTCLRTATNNHISFS